MKACQVYVKVFIKDNRVASVNNLLYYRDDNINLSFTDAYLLKYTLI